MASMAGMAAVWTKGSMSGWRAIHKNACEAGKRLYGICPGRRFLIARKPFLGIGMRSGPTPACVHAL